MVTAELRVQCSVLAPSPTNDVKALRSGVRPGLHIGGSEYRICAVKVLGADQIEPGSTASVVVEAWLIETDLEAFRPGRTFELHNGPHRKWAQCVVIAVESVKPQVSTR